LRIVAIGGGHGLSTLLKGLKAHSVHLGPQLAPLPPLVDITAVVTVTDDGGSSGRLRREFDILPPGDIRNCMVALAEDEALITRLFEHRFAAGRGLKGHSFGNLFLAAMTQVTGDFPLAVRLSSEVLAIAGRIFPSTSANVRLRARLEDGSSVNGESSISRSLSPIAEVELVPSGCRPMRETLEAIRQADLITLGPGSLYTSLIPNLLVGGIARAIELSPARKVCLVNLMWQPGETTGMSASDHIEAIQRHAGRRFIDCAVLNTEPIRMGLLARYARQRAFQVTNDLDRLKAMGVQVIALPLLAEGAKVRHDPERTAQVVIGLARKARRNRTARSGGKPAKR
jgi:uncharacterized cofD-like protein